MSEQLATTEAQPMQVAAPKKQQIQASERGLKFQSLDDMWRFATCIVNSGMYKDIQTPEVALVRIQAGLELGLSPVWALSNITTVNGKVVVWGDALIGIVRAHPQIEDVIETVEGTGDAMVARCEVRRRGCAPVIRTFSVADAKKASLWGKAGPWQQYPARMLAMRARGFACRDAAPDALRGLLIREEVQDYQQIPPAKARVVSTETIQFADETPAIEVTQAPEPKEDLF